MSLLFGPLATALVLLWPPIPESGSSDWTSRQLIAGGSVALAGALMCSLVALSFDSGFVFWSLCAFFLVGAGIYAWLFVRERPA